MKRYAILLAASAALSAAPAFAQLPLHVGGPAADLANGVHYDDAGNSYVVGAFRGTADFDPGPGLLNLTSAGNTDAFVAIYDPGGNVLFAWPIRGPGQETANDVRFFNGLVYVTGYYAAGADFLGTFPANGGGLDGYVAAFSVASGTPVLVWLSPISGANDQIGEDLDVHPFPPFNVWATGSLRATADFDPGAPIFNLTSAGNTDVFVAAYNDLTGGLFDAFRVGAGAADTGLGLSLLRPNLPCVTGSFRGTVDFAPGGPVFNVVSAGNEDGFAACYLVGAPGAAALFAPFNAFNIGGTGVDRGYDLDANGAAGAINVTGAFSGVANFNGPVFVSNGNLDAFVASYNTAGANLWVVPFGRAQPDAGLGIDSDDCGNVVATGGFRAGPVNFDPFGAGYFVPTFGNYDAWVAGYSNTGAFRFANRIARNGLDLGYSVAVKPSGAHVAAGEFAQNPVFSSGTNLSAITPFASYGSQDGYLAAYNVNGAIRRLSCPPPPPKLQVWTDFDAFSAGLFLDLSAPATPANDGGVIGFVGTGPGVVDNAGFFPTGADAILIPADPSLALGLSDLSVDGWVQLNGAAVAPYLTIASLIGTPNVGSYEVRLIAAGPPPNWALSVTIDDGGGGPPVTLTSPPFPLPVGTWRFVGVTVDHTTTATFYVDGGVIGVAVGPPIGAVTTTGPLFLHRAAAFGGGDHSGALDEVEIFHTLLTPLDLTRLFRYGKCKPCWTAPYQPTMRTVGDDAGSDNAPRVRAASEAPMRFGLTQSLPNPTSGLTEIAFTLPLPSPVRLSVYDVLGREVARLVDERREAGRHVATFDAGALPSGVYLYRLEAGAQTATRRLTVSR